MPERLSLFEGYGIEIEYMIVDRDSLHVRSISDQVLEEASGVPACDYDDGEIAWSNELVLHLLEMKTNGPAADLAGLATAFQGSIQRLLALLEGKNARLMPSGMHPWMDPRRETKLWSREYEGVYRAYDAIFDCRRHGWANVQATHLNLPFADEQEFGRLLAAVRLLLPILPGLAAASPVVEGHVTGKLDTRLDFYRGHALCVPSMIGAVIPEQVFEFEPYQRRVLAPIYADLARFDEQRVLTGNEWVNARGAIARFDRNAIEIRLLDVQECPRADLAIAAAVANAARGLVEERWISWKSQCRWASEPLLAMLSETISSGPRAAIEQSEYSEALGCSGARTVGELWRELLERTYSGPAEYAEVLNWILDRGTLAERILDSLGESPPASRIAEVYAHLCDCLDSGRLFESHAPCAAT